MSESLFPVPSLELSSFCFSSSDVLIFVSYYIILYFALLYCHPIEACLLSSEI